MPLPWTPDGSSFGFGSGGAHLPQPGWYGDFAASVEQADPHSTLSLYVEALAARHRLQSAETLEWVEGLGDDVVAFRRPGGWLCVTNFGQAAVPLPDGTVVVSSALAGDSLPGEATAWVQEDR